VKNIRLTKINRSNPKYDLGNNKIIKKLRRCI
jgi:hypothetical protein